MSQHTKFQNASAGNPPPPSRPDPEPTRRLAIVTCMDARLDPMRQLGLDKGDAHVIRIAGGTVREALRSLLVSRYALQTSEIAVFHHEGCGMATARSGSTETGFEAAEFRRTLLEAARSAQASQDIIGQIEEMNFLELEPLDDSVKSDVDFLRAHPLFRGTTITGWVQDVYEGGIRLVVPCENRECGSPCCDQARAAM